MQVFHYGNRVNTNCISDYVYELVQGLLIKVLISESHLSFTRLCPIVNPDK